MPTIAVAGLSARAMAEAAARDGFDVLALDLFGDVDTCAVATRWLRIGDAAQLRIDPLLARQALQHAQRHGEVLGWVPGGGLEAQGDLLAGGAGSLTLLGTAARDVARVRNPAVFFDFLAANGIAHPAVSLQQLPEPRTGWLVKDAAGCGGWHIRDAASFAAGEALPLLHYAQRVAGGLSMSATLVANGVDAVVLGCNRQIIESSPARPCVYAGIVGPVDLPAQVLTRVQRVVRTLAGGFALRGLCSLDFLLDGEELQVLEVNPRCPASVELYPEAQPMAAHVRACLQGVLPAVPLASRPAPLVHGNLIVRARRALLLDATAALWLNAWPGAHDRPCAGQHFAVGDPLCSLGAQGGSVADVLAAMHEGREALLTSLETVSS